MHRLAQSNSSIFVIVVLFAPGLYLAALITWRC